VSNLSIKHMDIETLIDVAMVPRRDAGRLRKEVIAEIKQRIARLEAENLKLQKLLRIARDYTTAPAQVRGELFRTMCEQIEAIDAAKGGT